MDKLNVFESEKIDIKLLEPSFFQIEKFKFLSDISDGARKKIWYNYGDREFLFKQNKRHSTGEYTMEHVSEWLAKKIADMLRIPCVNIILCENAIFSEKMWQGAELKSFLDYSEELSHSFHLSNLQTYNVRTLLSEKNVYRGEIIDMLLFDILIGNSDRHPGNYLYADAEGFYPLFDNGSSLCAYVREEQIGALLRDEMRFHALCDTKSKPVLRDEQKLTHKLLLSILDKSFSKEVKDFKERLTLLDLEILYVDFWSEDRNKLLSKFLQERIKWFYE